MSTQYLPTVPLLVDVGGAMKDAFLEVIQTILEWTLGVLMRLLMWGIEFIVVPPHPTVFTTRDYTVTDTNPGFTTEVSDFISMTIFHDINSLMTSVSFALLMLMIFGSIAAFGLSLMSGNQAANTTFWSIVLLALIAVSDIFFAIITSIVYDLAILVLDLSRFSIADLGTILATWTGVILTAFSAGIVGGIVITAFKVCLLIITIILLLFFFALKLGYFIAYAIFPLVILGWGAQFFPFKTIQSQANKLTGFVVPLFWVPIVAAVVFVIGLDFLVVFESGSVGDAFASAELSEDGIASLNRSLIAVFFGPLFFTSTIAIGLWMLLKSFSLGRMVVSGTQTLALAGLTGAGISAAGGVAAKRAGLGYAYRGMEGAAVGSLAGAGQAYGDPDQTLNSEAAEDFASTVEDIGSQVSSSISTAADATYPKAKKAWHPADTGIDTAQKAFGLDQETIDGYNIRDLHMDAHETSAMHDIPGTLMKDHGIDDPYDAAKQDLMQQFDDGDTRLEAFDHLSTFHKEHGNAVGTAYAKALAATDPEKFYDTFGEDPGKHEVGWKTNHKVSEKDEIDPRGYTQRAASIPSFLSFNDIHQRQQNRWNEKSAASLETFTPPEDTRADLIDLGDWAAHENGVETIVSSFDRDGINPETATGTNFTKPLSDGQLQNEHDANNWMEIEHFNDLGELNPDLEGEAGFAIQADGPIEGKIASELISNNLDWTTPTENGGRFTLPSNDNKTKNILGNARALKLDGGSEVLISGYAQELQQFDSLYRRESVDNGSSKTQSSTTKTTSQPAGTEQMSPDDTTDQDPQPPLDIPEEALAEMLDPEPQNHQD